MEVRPYWQPNLNDELRVSASEASCRLVELINSSVEMRMRSDVPLGAFLSGGVDSSLIVALMQQRTSQPIKTFTIGFPIAEYDETSYAQQVARHLGTDHEELQVAPDAVSILPKLVWNYDEPFADSSAIPTWYVSEMTRRHVTVALSGDGGDELFAGYPRYKAVWLASHFDQLGPLRSSWPPESGSEYRGRDKSRWSGDSSVSASSSARRHNDGTLNGLRSITSRGVLRCFATILSNACRMTTLSAFWQRLGASE